MSTYAPPGSSRPSLNRMLMNSPRPASARWQPQHWRLRTKLIALTAVPVLLAIVLGVLRVADTAKHSHTAAVRDGVIIGVFVLLSLGLLVVLARSVLRPLRILRGAAFDVADRRLPGVIEQLRTSEGRDSNVKIDPVPVYSREDVGQVARAFDAVHSEAVRLASEQAALRANVNDMFVNLSRRSQGLVERQLRLIDELELGEQDSERLGALFRLDHLATRMRRNGENLLVLAGADLRQRSGEPVPILDVLRAAVSEIEDYQRVAMRPLPRALVSGLAVNDIVHLVAELLDNATAYSDPESQVTLTARFADEGGIAVEIRDAGTGIPAARLFEINQRLSAPPSVDVSVSRQMGLFVVGRLANRHGIAVTLATGPDGSGTVVTAQIPKLLVTAESGEPAQRGDYLDRSYVDAPPLPPVTRGYVDQPPTLPPALPLPASTDDTDIFRPAAATFLDPEPSRWQEQPAEPPATLPATLEEPVNGVIPAQRGLLDSSGELPAINGEQFDTPIFASVLSNWFTERQEPAGASPAPEPPTVQPPAPEPEPEPEPGYDTAPTSIVDTDTADTAAVADELPLPVPIREPRRPEGGWESVADAGWRAAEAASQPTAEEFTAAGLPKRRPQAFLVPGTAGGSWMSEGQPAMVAASRNAEALRGRMSSYQRGLKLGRHAQRGGASEPADDARDEQPVEGNQ